jgi:hypothetical protein
VSGLNAPIKRCKLTDRIKTQDPTICCLQETHSLAMKYRLKGQPLKILLQKQAELVVHISNKLDFKTKINLLIKKKNPPRRYNASKFICINFQSTQFYKINATKEYMEK